MEENMNPKMLAIDASKALDLTVQAIHKKLKSKELDFKKTQNRIYFNHTSAKELFNLNFKPQTISVHIVKGGTGKTTIVNSLAIRASLYGARVLCVDLDQQGNLTQSLNVNPSKMPIMIDILEDNIPIEKTIIPILPGLDLLPSRLENAIIDNTIMLKRLPLDRIFKEKFNHLKQKYDLIIIDCPPALGQSVSASILASDLLIAPVTPEKFSLSGLKVTSQEVLELEKNFQKKIIQKILLNKFDNRTILSHETITSLIQHNSYNKKLFKTCIRVSQEFPNATGQGISIFDTTKPTTAKEDIDSLTQELLGIKSNQTSDLITLGSLDES